MIENYMLYPATITQLVQELRRACDDYNARRITNNDFRELVLYYAQEHPEKIFAGDDYNPTLQIKLGKKRMAMLEKMLEGYQFKIS